MPSAPPMPTLPPDQGQGLSAGERSAQSGPTAWPATVEPPTQRRRELLEAAAIVVSQNGLRGLTHRAVDAHAHVPLGSTSTSYRTRLALLSALARYVGQQLLAGVEVLRSRVDALPKMPDEEHSVAVADEVITALLALAQREHLVRVQCELVLEAVRTPELLDVLDPWRRALVEIVASICATVGPIKAADRAETTVAAFQGVLIASLWQPDALRTAYVERSSRQLLDLLHPAAQA